MGFLQEEQDFQASGMPTVISKPRRVVHGERVPWDDPPTMDSPPAPPADTPAAAPPPVPPRPGRSLRRRLVYAGVASALVLGLVTLALSALERRGVVDTYRQDDSVLYLHGRYLTLDATQTNYVIMDAQAPTVVQATFPVKKDPSVFRIFIAGESFVRGGHQLPPGHAPVGYGTIADWTRELLQARYPSQRFEVINAGASGQGSYRLAAEVAELVNASPDIIVVATGNNEGMAPVPGISEELNDWILYRMLKKTVLVEPAKADRPAFQPQMLGARELGDGFERNLRAMIKAAKDKGVRLSLATLPLNLMQIASTVSQGENAQFTSDPACAPVAQLATSGDCDGALEASTRCPRQFHSAVTSAECLRKAERYDEARELYRAAIQIDPRGRTRPSFNETIRRLDRENGLLLIDLEARMTERSEHGLTGGKHFIDPVHMTCMGYLPVARNIVDALIDADLIHGTWTEPKRDPTAAELLAAHPWDPTKDGYTPPPNFRDRVLRVCAPDPTQE